MRPSRRFVTLVAVALTTVLALPGLSRAATTEVAVDDDFFSPGVATIALGDSVHWSRAGGSNGNHNVAEVSGIFRSGDPTTGAIDLTVVFSAGSFRYWCEIHSPDMDGTIAVPVKIRSAPSGLPFTVAWASLSTTSGSKWDIQYKVGNGLWRNWKTDTTSFKGVFGKRNVPVRVVAGRTYRFRARSQSGTATSLWAPVRSFRA